MGEDDTRPDFPLNPPGYGETIGCVVLYDPPDDVIEAAYNAYFAETAEAWAESVRRTPELADRMRARMRRCIQAAVEASRGLETTP